MANNQLAVYQSLAFGDLTEQDIITIRETIGKDCNESQFKLFMAISKNADANPVLNEIYPAVRGGQLTVQFGIDFYVRKAKETDGYLGYDVQLVHDNDEFKMHQEKAEDGRYFMVIDEHSFGFPRGKVIGGYAIAYREGMKPFTVIMDVEEVEHYKKSNIGMQKTMWTNNFNDMFKKHMVRRALKAAFELNFDDETVENKGSNNIPEYKPRDRKDITPNQEVIDLQPDVSKKKSEGENEEEKAIRKIRDDIKIAFEQLGIMTKEEKAAYTAKHAPNVGENPSYADLIGLLQLLEMNIEVQNMQKTNPDVLD